MADIATTTHVIGKVVLRDDFRDTMRDHGNDTPAQIARALNVAQSTVARILDHTSYPSPRFIARAMHITGRPFEDLFTTQ